jgi:hypothetical protein
MSAYARSSVTFNPSNGIHRFSQRSSAFNKQRDSSSRRPSSGRGQSNERPSSNGYSNKYNEPASNIFIPPNNIDNHDEFYPFSQITMSQSTVKSDHVDNTNGASNNNASRDTLENRAAKWRSSRKEFERSQSLLLQASDKPSSENKATKAAQLLPSAAGQRSRFQSTPGRRDKRSKLSLGATLKPTVGRLANSIQRSNITPAGRSNNIASAGAGLSNITSMQRSITASAGAGRSAIGRSYTPASFSSTLMARGASAVMSAMTPLRSFARQRRIGLGLNGGGVSGGVNVGGGNFGGGGNGSVNVGAVSGNVGVNVGGNAAGVGAYSAQLSQEPSPLDRPKKNRKPLVTTANTTEGTQEVVDFQTNQDDERSKTSVSTYDPDPPRAAEKNVDCAAQDTEVTTANKEVNAEDPTVNKDVNATDVDQMADLLTQIQNAQRQFNETKQAMEEQYLVLNNRYQEVIRQQELLEKERSDAKAEFDAHYSQLEGKMRDLLEIKCTSDDFKTEASNQHQVLISQMDNVKMEMMAKFGKFVDESKARIQVCGRLEMEALEGMCRVGKEELRDVVDGGKREIELECKRAVEDVRTSVREVGLPDQSVVATLSARNADATVDKEMDACNVEKENAKPMDGNSPIKSSKVDSTVLCKTSTSDNTSAELHEDDASSFDDDGSLLNNSSLAPAPPKKNASVKKQTVKTGSSVYSARTAPRAGMSVSTTPFSAKTTPRMQNSYTKKQSVTGAESTRKKTPINEVVNGTKCASRAAGISSEPPSPNITNISPKLVQSTKKDTSSGKKTKSKAALPISLEHGKKRSRADFDAIKSPRRSKRVREASRVEQRRALEASLSQDSVLSRKVTPKEDPKASPLVRKKTYGKSPSPTDSFKTSPASSNGTDSSDDMFLGKSVVVNADQDQNIGGLDGCESIVQRDVGPLAVPWGARSGPAKSRKTYSTGRKRDRKPFSFETISSIFEFKF